MKEKTKSNRGGKRAGAGRPPGVSKRIALRDYLKESDIEQFFEFLLANYMKDSRLMIWMGDHLLGKAPQAITGTDGGPLVIEISEAIVNKHGTASSPATNS